MSIFSRRKKTVSSEQPFYDAYKDIRDEAWRVLAENQIKELPVDLVRICEAENIDLYSYAQAQVLIASLHIEKCCISGGCSVLMPDGRRIVLYDDAVPVEMRRWLIACGIGYFCLGYADVGRRDENMLLHFTQEEQMQAGIFAGRLLAPLSVLWSMGVQNAQEISRVCLIPATTAEKRFARLAEIEARHLDRGTRTGQGTLFLSGYERCAYRNFSTFAEEYRQKNRK